MFKFLIVKTISNMVNDVDPRPYHGNVNKVLETDDREGGMFFYSPIHSATYEDGATIYETKYPRASGGWKRVPKNGAVTRPKF